MINKCGPRAFMQVADKVTVSALSWKSKEESLLSSVTFALSLRPPSFLRERKRRGVMRWGRGEQRPAN